ncbi:MULTISPECIES: copper resistance protein B [unclassified Brevundimonas]|uniref:copper resistance protein B n=1 Tax=unclassified Brevundimonas TaxID=2622653 RepID=UPI0020048451|nr:MULTISPECIES: copper resistance protein B [unclassified Brevundimonas]MCK6105898.1 copper resistance protein B [Brevundimonas sp. EYE_349]
MSRLFLTLTPLLLAAGLAQAQSVDPHAGHHQAQPARAATPTVDPHAGHAMPPSVDPHAGHDMGRMDAQPADPHAGHDMSTMGATADPHAGHDRGGMSMAAPNAPPPSAALSGPAHAADTVFGAQAMAASRSLLIAENGDVRTTGVVIDRLEAGLGDGADAYLWDAQGWTGGDIHRLWWKTEGEGDLQGRLHEAEIQALYSRAISPFWNLQAGVRQDIRPDGPDATHVVLGFQGLAPHWWEIDAAAFLSTKGDLSAKVEAEYDQRITQRLILQPRVEAALSARDAPELDLGAGLSSIQAGLRLRYEFTREFAPYFGIEWTRALGSTTDLIAARGGEADKTQVVVGLKAWF